MTVGLIGNDLIKKIEPSSKEFVVRDSRLQGFMLRVYPSGIMSYAVQYKRGKRIHLGKVGVLTPMQAREKAIKILADYAQGLDPKSEPLESKDVPTLREFLDKEYAAWLTSHNPTGNEDIKRLFRYFSYLMGRPIDQIIKQDIEKWRTEKLETKSMQANTINRIITPLRSAISKAVEWGVISHHGLAGLKILKHDDTRVRYLSEDEKRRLFASLKEREKLMKDKRRNANQWRKERGYELHAEIEQNEFADHLMPMVILTLNTGLRRGEILSLKRENINLEQATLFVAKSKNYLSRYVPLNETAKKALKTWLDQTVKLNSQYLFPNPNNPSKPIQSIKSAWTNLKKEAKINNFHWHDLRHDFASRLVMKEVSLYAVQKLLGHKQIDQTMKYAHLAPSYIAESVSKLDL